MTKASPTRRAKKQGIIAPQTRNLTPQEALELQEMQRLVNGHKFVAAQVKGNTALVADGQRYAQQLEATASLLENAKNHWVQSKLRECGYLDGTKMDINLMTGEIILQSDEPTNVEAAAN